MTSGGGPIIDASRLAKVLSAAKLASRGARASNPVDQVCSNKGTAHCSPHKGARSPHVVWQPAYHSSTPLNQDRDRQPPSHGRSETGIQKTMDRTFGMADNKRMAATTCALKICEQGIHPINRNAHLSYLIHSKASLRNSSEYLSRLRRASGILRSPGKIREAPPSGGGNVRRNLSRGP